MTRTFDPQYSSIQSHLVKLKPIIVSIEDEINNLSSASSTDDLTKLSILVGRNLVEAMSIIDDVKDIDCSISTSIDSIDDADQKELEQDEYKTKIDSVDGSTELPLNHLSLSYIISKLEATHDRTLHLTAARIATVTRLISNQSLNNVSSPSTNQSPITSTHHDGVSLDQSSVSNVDTLIQSLILSLNQKPTHTPNVALPPIQLETFDGSDITRWPAFVYQLEELILNQDHLNEVEKAYYVRSSLRGTALNLVASIPTQKNFLTKIVERLKLEYDRSSLTQATLLQSLLSLRSNSTKLEDQIDTVRSMINIAQTIDKSCGLDGLITQQQIADHVNPRFISLIWKRKPETLLAALQLIEETLRSELEEVTITSAFSEQSIRFQSSVETHFNNSVVKSNVDNHFPSFPTTSKGPTCVYCGKHAFSAECTTVQSTTDRKEILRRQSLCFCCFSTKHSTTACSKKCSICSGKHHRSICEKSPPISMNTHTVCTNDTQRLFTAEVNVANPDSAVDAVITANIHLDHGAQASLISRELANRLCLIPFEQRELTISGFDGKPARSSIYDIVNVLVDSDRGRFHIKAIVQDKSPLHSIITQPLPEVDLDVVKSTIGDIPNQFSNQTVFHTDLLLGVGDTLALLEKSNVTSLPSGYKLVRSSIGPLVVGSSRSRIKSIDPRIPNPTSNEISSSSPLSTVHSKPPILDPPQTTISTVTVHSKSGSNIKNNQPKTNKSLHHHANNRFLVSQFAPLEDSNAITHCNLNPNITYFPHRHYSIHHTRPPSHSYHSITRLPRHSTIRPIEYTPSKSQHEIHHLFRASSSVFDICLNRPGRLDRRFEDEFLHHPNLPP